MHIHPYFGVSVPERGWVPAPRYLLRRSRVLRLLAGFPPGRLLEVGCGAGALSYDVARRGFAVTALEPSSEAREIACYVNRETEGFVAACSPVTAWSGSFDHVLALEVLEHIADDAAALRQWHDWLKPGGHLLLSVPAHGSRWSATDDWAGHYRRYGRGEILGLLGSQGFEVSVIECYGFPLANMVDPFRARYHARQLRLRAAGDRTSSSHRSGIERSLEVRLYPLQACAAGTLAMRFFCSLQALFSNTDLGTGFVVLCRCR